jgi:MFS family permease
VQDNKKKPDESDIPMKVQAPVYAAGLFSNSMSDVAAIILPLWLAGLGMSPAAIGIVIGAKHILPFLLAIHGGALMDKLGARRLMVVCALLSAAVALLFPLTSWVPIIFALQMLNGFGSTIGFLGAQTAFAQILKGSHRFAGRFAFCMRMGGLMGPPIAGVVFDTMGLWGSFVFLSSWAIAMAIAAWLMPQPVIERPGPPVRFAMIDLVPRWSDYASAFRLATLPAVSIMLVITVIRIASSAVQDSFYPLYLNESGFSATQIGLLVTISAAIAAVGALCVTSVIRYMKPLWVLLAATVGSIVFVAITPLLHSFETLAVASGLRGFCMGISQPLILSILVHAAGPGSQGKTIALRTTANRAAAGLTPVGMGLAAATTSLASSFFIVGGVLLAACAVTAVYMRRRPELTRDR